MTDDETRDERRQRVMDRLAEILQGPPPEPGGTTASMEEALAELPEEAAAMFRAMLEGFQAWQRGPRQVEEPGEPGADESGAGAST